MEYSIKDLTGWGTYTDNYVFKYNGKWIHTIKYNDNCGFSFWKFYTSPNRTNRDEHCLWRGKNSRGRKLETRYFITRDEAVEVAKKEIDK